MAAEPETGLITDCEMTMAAGPGSTNAENGVKMAARDRFGSAAPLRPRSQSRERARRPKPRPVPLAAELVGRATTYFAPIFLGIVTYVLWRRGLDKGTYQEVPTSGRPVRRPPRTTVPFGE